MKRENIQPHFVKFVKDFEKQTVDTIKLITSNLSKESKLKEKDISDILLDFLNKGATMNKASYMCPTCYNQDIKCPTCDAYIKELKGEPII